LFLELFYNFYSRGISTTKNTIANFVQKHILIICSVLVNMQILDIKKNQQKGDNWGQEPRMQNAEFHSMVHLLLLRHLQDSND